MVPGAIGPTFASPGTVTQLTGASSTASDCRAITIR